LPSALCTRYFLSNTIKIRTIVQGTNCPAKKIKKKEKACLYGGMFVSLGMIMRDIKNTTDLNILGVKKAQVKIYTVFFGGRVYEIKREGDWMAYTETITDVESGKEVSDETDMDFILVLRSAFFTANNGSTF